MAYDFKGRKMDLPKAYMYIGKEESCTCNLNTENFNIMEFLISKKS